MTKHIKTAINCNIPWHTGNVEWINYGKKRFQTSMSERCLTLMLGHIENCNACKYCKENENKRLINLKCEILFCKISVQKYCKKKTSWKKKEIYCKIKCNWWGISLQRIAVFVSTRFFKFRLVNSALKKKKTIFINSWNDEWHF